MFAGKVFAKKLPAKSCIHEKLCKFSDPRTLECIRMIGIDRKRTTGSLNYIAGMENVKIKTSNDKDILFMLVLRSEPYLTFKESRGLFVEEHVLNTFWNHLKISSFGKFSP